MTGNTERAVLLDLDDTLYAERSYFESGLAAVADFVAGEDPDARLSWRRRLSADVREHGRDGALDRIAPPAAHLGDPSADPSADGPAEGWRAALLHVYRTHRPQLSAFPDVDGFIARARSQGWRLGLVTDGKSCVQWRKLEALGLDRRLDAVICSDDIDAKKPAVEPFLAAAARLGVAPRACIYLADDPSKDFIGPHRLAMGSVQVRRALAHPLARPAPHPDAEARHRVASLTEASELLFGASS